ncbi:MAG: hypothetical protein M3O09_18725 [Acidobacteriota bacterium]|jgi:hypothetical protein|nr:hypothetical protein [Acidobacteriota bacterium]
MKNPMEVLRLKEQELLKVKNEVAALKITMRLLSDGSPLVGNGQSEPKKVLEMQ